MTACSGCSEAAAQSSWTRVLAVFSASALASGPASTSSLGDGDCASSVHDRGCQACCRTSIGAPILGKTDIVRPGSCPLPSYLSHRTADCWPTEELKPTPGLRPACSRCRDAASPAGTMPASAPAGPPTSVVAGMWPDSDKLRHPVQASAPLR